MQLDPQESIAAFYAGRSIFITGGTGFMGKVLIEKLLRSCPDVQEIFLLMRPKKGMSIDDRLRKMLNLALFDKLREKDPSAFKKLIPVSGDVSEEGLGLPTIERRVLIERVSIIFHVAANVRFDDPLKEAILMNVRGTKEVCILAASMKKLVVLLHVSTTYGNTDRPVIDETLYPAHANWKEAIKIAETIDDQTLNTMTAKYLGKLPNTYTFTKQLAEHVINDYAEVVPSAIFRPSVVVSTMEEPIRGWVDNFNGPVGMLVGGGKGVLRAIHADPDLLVDYIPVDLSIKALLISAWKRGLIPITKDPSVPVYNCSSYGIKAITNRNVMTIGFQIAEEFPLDGILWYPNATMYTSKSIYYLNFLIFQLLPALVIDVVLKLSGAKPILLKLQRKIFTANFALHYFLIQTWAFKNEKLLKLLTSLPEVNKPEFECNMSIVDIRGYYKDCVIGSKLYLLKEDMSKIPQAKAFLNKLWWIDRTLKVWFAIFVTWAVLSSGILVYIYDSVTSVFDVWTS